MNLLSTKPFFLFAICCVAAVFNSYNLPSAMAAPRLAVRVKVTQFAGQAPDANQNFKLTWGESSQEFSGGNWSEWALWEKYNGESIAPTVCSVSPQPAPAEGKFPRLKLQVESAVEDGEKSSNEAELFGPTLSLVAWKTGDAIHIDTRAGHTKRVYGPLFEAAQIPVNERPKLITFGDRYILGTWEDNNLESWHIGYGGLAGLGINAAASTGYEGVPAVTQAIRETGIGKVWNAVYNPPGYAFNFDPNRQDVFQKFVSDQVEKVLASGWTKDEIAYWVTSDEPGWYYPSVYNQFNADPNAIKAFHEYLQENGLTPKMLGKNSWNEIKIIGRKEYFDLPSRRLFYWSNRFIPLASARFFSEVTKSYEAGIRPGVPVLVNFNNFMGLFYNPGPVANNPDKQSPNAAMGQHDWLEWGRERGSTSIATEDWFGDWAASYWSFYAARLRSAAELSGDDKVGFGGLIIPRESGLPGGMSRKIMAMVGNGAKTIEFFIFGPEWAFPGNCWSENPDVYEEISAGTRLVGKAEDLLFPGKTRRPEVAILTPQSSQLWDLEDQEIASGLYEATNTNMHGARMEYTSEMFSLYHALQRSAIPANFVDEKALTEPRLKDYKVLYVTAPDLPQESVAGLLEWVRAGGVLVTLPGAGQNDRYHQAITTLNDASGIEPEKSMRELSDWNGATANGTFKIGEETLTVFGRREPLKTTGAKTVHAFDDGAPAVTSNALGQGRIIHFAFLPGLSYYRATAQPNVADRLHSGSGMRELVASPVRYANVSLPVTVDRALIEAPALYSEKGIAVTLLNYGEETKNAEVKNIEVSVASEKPVTRVESVNQRQIKFVQQDGRVTVSLPLGDVDVLKLYY